MRDTESSNMHLQGLIAELLKKSIEEGVPLWKRIAHDLSKPTRSRRIVNLSRLNRYTEADETIIVPGKVLGSGSIDHKLNIAALSFSESAVHKLETVGGKAISIHELISKNPKGKSIKIIG